MLRWCAVLGVVLSVPACGPAAAAEEAIVIDRWQLFSYVDLTAVEMGDLRTMPTVLPGEDGRLVRPVEVRPDAEGLIDLRTIAGGFHKKACAMLFAEVHAAEPTTLRIGTSADWWMEWRVNGEQVLSTLDFGNNRYYLGERNRLTDYVLDLPLKQGPNLIAVKVLAGSRQWFLYAGTDDDVRAARPYQHKRLADYLDRPLEFLHDEDAIAPYELPKLLTAADGTAVTTTAQWERTRRGEILDAFNHAIYGAIPRQVDRVEFETAVEDADSVDGLAIRKKVLITVHQDGRSLQFPMHLFVPKQADGPVPVVLFIYQRHPDGRWDFRTDGRYWPIRRLIENGFAAASFDRTFLAPDSPEHFREGILAMYPEHTARPDGWRAISAWAYGAMRCIDYLITDPAIDADRIAVAGHSRGGKTALWTAANDTRVGLAIVNGSGCLGAALSRRKVGEHLPGTNRSNPHWYNDNYHACTDENDLPVDQHMLIALVAPRAICIGGALGDPEADPKGEYLALIAADPVYGLYGLAPVAAQGPPRLEQPVVADRRSYHIRYGNHDMNTYDWGVYIDAAKRVFGPDR